VVPIDAILKAVHAECGHVDLQREPAARRACRPGIATRRRGTARERGTGPHPRTGGGAVPGPRAPPARRPRRRPPERATLLEAARSRRAVARSWVSPRDRPWCRVGTARTRTGPSPGGRAGGRWAAGCAGSTIDLLARRCTS